MKRLKHSPFLEMLNSTQYNERLNYFFNSYLTAPRPTLGPCREGSLRLLILITKFDTYSTRMSPGAS